MTMADAELHQAERRAWIRLALWFGIEPETARRAIREMEDATLLPPVTIEVAYRSIGPFTPDSRPANGHPD